MPVNGAAVATGTAGAVLLWSAVTGKGILKSVQDIVRGKSPGGIPAGGKMSPAGTAANVTGSPGGGSNAANQALGRMLAAPYGWSSGQEWTALNNIVMSESEWNASIKNPTSDASGIAQNINGFGPGYEEGNAAQQIQWLLSYIKGRYGDPIAAWQFHLANNWY